MPSIPEEIVETLLEKMDSDDPNEKGKALEDFMCDFFACVPGVIIAERNVMNAFNTEELDIALWNDKDPDGFHFLPYNLLVECKNWSSAVGTSEVSYFGDSLRRRGLDHGFFIAMNGITGDAIHLSRAHSIISACLLERIKLIVLDINDLKDIRHTDDLVELIKRKITKLHASGTL